MNRWNPASDLKRSRSFRPYPSPAPRPYAVASGRASRTISDITQYLSDPEKWIEDRIHEANVDWYRIYAKSRRRHPFGTSAH